MGQRQHQPPSAAGLNSNAYFFAAPVGRGGGTAVPTGVVVADATSFSSASIFSSVADCTGVGVSGWGGLGTGATY